MPSWNRISWQNLGLWQDCLGRSLARRFRKVLELDCRGCGHCPALVVGFLLIWQLVLVESGISRPTDCQIRRKQGTSKAVWKAGDLRQRVSVRKRGDGFTIASQRQRPNPPFLQAKSS